MTPRAAEVWRVETGDCRDVLPTLERVDHVITDPPYSRHQHEAVRSGKRDRPLAAGDGRYDGCATRRIVDLGFEYLSPALRRFCAAQFSRAARRWVMCFSDVESSWLWRLSLGAAGLDYVRTMQWSRIGGAPQFTGDRPASGCEDITLAHPRGRKRWNGGGKRGVYEFPIVANRLGQQGSRVHPTQKPLDLMLALVEDFTDPGDLVLDPFCGSGTTGVACLRLGRRFIGIERNAEWAELARERLSAEGEQSDLASRRAGQGALFR